MHKTILIVDDDAHIRDLLTLFLEQAGFEVRVCKDGYSGLEEVSNRPFDLVVLDIAMPHMNGLKVLQKMKESSTTKQIPVLMLTGSSDKSDVKKASGLGVTDYVIKPPNKKDFLQRVERILGGSPQFEQLYFDSSDPKVTAGFHPKISIHSISRKGMVLKSNFQMTPGQVLQGLESPLLDEICMTCRDFTVAECHMEEEGEYLVHISFLKLNQNDLEKVSRWIVSESFDRKSKRKVAS